MDNATDDLAVVLAAHTGIDLGKTWLNRRPGPLAQPVLVRHGNPSTTAISTALNRKLPAIPSPPIEFAVYPFASADLAWQILRKLTDGEGAAMARNGVQFQKGLSEAAFEERYGTEDKCRAVVMASRWPNGFACPACGGRAYSEVTTRRLFQCNACRHQTSLTAGTIFASTHLPLRLWFRAMYHLTQSKQGISSVELGRRLGVKQFT